MSMINSVTVVGGKDKDGAAEAVSMLEIKAGEIFAVVGTTGSGKSMLIADIEQWADGETPSQRHILINQVPAAEFAEDRLLRGMAAEVSQNMNFVMDMSVRDFLCLHARSRSLEQPEELAEQVINYANRLSGEAISGKDKLTVLSGGQSRALMVADVALISDAPVVLIDEIENAGIDRLAALKGLTLQDKIVVLVTHDLIVIAYMGDGGGYAIGSQHLVNATNRNDQVTTILVNNTNYAMTGGQMAPTTMPGQKTETTPYGRDVKTAGYPMMGPEMVAAISHDGAYVARGSVAKFGQLKRYLKKAIENQVAGRGFSFVEALSTCPTNWRTNAVKTWSFLEEQMTKQFPPGELKVPAGKEE
jgi:ABC-type lipoprotein export system ATPase subunit